MEYFKSQKQWIMIKKVGILELYVHIIFHLREIDVGQKTGKWK